MNKIVHSLIIFLFILNTSEAHNFKKISNDIISIHKALKVDPKTVKDPLAQQPNWQDPRKLQNMGGKYPVIEMIREYQNFDFRKGTIYFNDLEREERLIFIKNGSFYRKKTNKRLKGLFHQNGSIRGYVFAMDQDGNIYMEIPGKDIHVKKFHHSSFLAGKPVAMAGTIELNHEGKIYSLSTMSGHYRPPMGLVDNIIEELKERGINYPFFVSDFGTSLKYKPIGGMWLCCRN